MDQNTEISDFYFPYTKHVSVIADSCAKCRENLQSSPSKNVEVQTNQDAQNIAATNNNSCCACSDTNQQQSKYMVSSQTQSLKLFCVSPRQIKNGLAAKSPRRQSSDHPVPVFKQNDAEYNSYNNSTKGIGESLLVNEEDISNRSHHVETNSETKVNQVDEELIWSSQLDSRDKSVEIETSNVIIIPQELSGYTETIQVTENEYPLLRKSNETNINQRSESRPFSYIKKPVGLSEDELNDVRIKTDHSTVEKAGSNMNKSHDDKLVTFQKRGRCYNVTEPLCYRKQIKCRFFPNDLETRNELNIEEKSTNCQLLQKHIETESIKYEKEIICPFLRNSSKPLNDKNNSMKKIDKSNQIINSHRYVNTIENQQNPSRVYTKKESGIYVKKRKCLLFKKLCKFTAGNKNEAADLTSDFSVSGAPISPNFNCKCKCIQGHSEVSTETDYINSGKEIICPFFQKTVRYISRKNSVDRVDFSRLQEPQQTDNNKKDIEILDYPVCNNQSEVFCIIQGTIKFSKQIK